MNRTTVAVVATPLVLLSGCLDYGFTKGPPEWPHSVAPPLAEVEQTDQIVQVTTPKVDVLWTIDNSCSMSDNQKDLVSYFPAFMDYFLGSGLDYHIGVTTTDIDMNENGAKGKLVVIGGIKFLDPETPSPIDVFDAMATRGTTGSGNEKGTGGTFMCLEDKRDTANAGFWRDDASINTIIISDEPDSTPSNIITEQEFVGWYDGLKQDHAMRTFSSVIDPNYGTRYASITDQIGGIKWDIDNDDWAQVLELLGIQAAGLKREYFLSHLPVDDSIDVSIHDVTGADLAFKRASYDVATGVVGDGDWYYLPDRNSITFVEYIPNSLSTVVIHYKLLAAEQQEEVDTVGG